MILKYGIVDRLHDTSILGRISQLNVVLANLLA